MNLHIKRINKALPVPKYNHDTDAGIDLYASEDCLISSNETKIIATGVAFKIPENYVGLIWDRSGLAAKNSLHSLGGVIDAGFRGEIKVIIKNFSNEDYQVNQADRIAQILIQPVEKCEIIEVDELDDTPRGEKYFGSSGK
jgi:dUTP pyrophosphatase